MSTQHIKRIGIGLAVGFVLALLFSLDTATHSQNTTIPFNRQTHPTVRRTLPRVGFQSSAHRIEDAELKHFQDSDFYRTIIDNNIFRPLGWRPPRPIEPYRLIGTILPRRANTPPRAILQTTAGNQTYIMSLGENLSADTEVVLIESKRVVLSTNGQQRTLKLPSGF